MLERQSETGYIETSGHQLASFNQPLQVHATNHI